jgi:hypothetical protein
MSIVEDAVRQPIYGKSISFRGAGAYDHTVALNAEMLLMLDAPYPLFGSGSRSSGHVELIVHFCNAQADAK